MTARLEHELDERWTPTVERKRYNLAERLLDGLATGSRSIGLPLTRLDRDSLLASARRRTNLEDFGDDRFLEGLDRILSEAAGRYTGLGDVVLRGLLLKGLEARLRTVDYLKRHPDVLEVPITEPIIILGLPRSGTTVLQRLLAASLDRSQLELWELMSVTPVNGADLEADKRRRIRDSARLLRLAKLSTPEVDRMHHATPTTPEEDWLLQVPSFHTLMFQSAFGLEEYGRWLREEADMIWAYGEARQLLQIILHQRPRQRLVLKSTTDHLWFIDALMEAFPDACFVHTQRDPVDCIASCTSMISVQERRLTGRIEWRPLARRLTDHLLDGARRSRAARARHDERRFCDAPFDELVRDPGALMRMISDHFGLPAPSEASIANELAKPRADRPGSHRYSHERLGLEPEVIRRSFGWPNAIDA